MENLQINSLGEALGTGGAVALQGMATVFGVLILLMIVLILMKVIFYKDPAKQKAVVPEVKQEEAPVVKAEGNKDDMDEEELIAVLTAAVAASLNTSTYNLRIKSYRRTGTKAPAWNRAGLEETVNHY